MVWAWYSCDWCPSTVVVLSFDLVVVHEIPYAGIPLGRVRLDEVEGIKRPTPGSLTWESLRRSFVEFLIFRKMDTTAYNVKEDHQRATEAMMPPESAPHVASGESGPVLADQAPLRNE